MKYDHIETMRFLVRQYILLYENPANFNDRGTFEEHIENVLWNDLQQIIADTVGDLKQEGLVQFQEDVSV